MATTQPQQLILLKNGFNQASKLLRSQSNQAFIGCKGTVEGTDPIPHRTQKTHCQVSVPDTNGDHQGSTGPHIPQKSELFCWHENDQSNAQQFVLIFWLICICPMICKEEINIHPVVFLKIFHANKRRQRSAISTARLDEKCLFENKHLLPVSVAS